MAFPGRKNGLEKGICAADAPFIHYSPPRVVEARRWARGGDIEKLQQAAIFGQGHKLLGIAAPGTKARAFLRNLPDLIAKCDTLHEAVTTGSLATIREILDTDPLKKRLSLCRDRAGVGLLHKAVYYDFQDIVEYLAKQFPQTTLMRDSEGRTPLHYVGTCSNPNEVMSVLLGAGAERNPMDQKQKTPIYYMNRPPELKAHIPLPSPPTPTQTSDLVIKPANIRIWCHDRDLGRLQQVVWKGQGARLRTEVSSQPAVKRFLEAIPHIMVSIKDIHTAAIENDLDKIKTLTEDPIPPIILSSQDVNGLTALHKAAGLGNFEIVKYLLRRFPENANIVDNDGKTPLHWSALPKDERIYECLLQGGAEEGKLDNKMKSAGYYKTRPGEIDKSLLGVVPDAPRIGSSTYPSSWDWNLFKADGQEQNTAPVPKPKKVIKAVQKIVEKPLTPPPKPITPPSPSPPREVTPEQEPVFESPDTDNDHEEDETEEYKEEEEFEANNNIDDHNHGTPNSIESENEKPKTGIRPETATIIKNGMSDKEEDLDEENLKDNVSEKSEERNKTAVLESNNSQDDDYDDDDVQVRGDSESEYGEFHKQDTAEVLDVEYLKQKERTRTRHGSEEVIEGVVNADPEVDSMDAEQLENNDEQEEMNTNMDDEDVQNMIDTGNMEQLASLVLNGDGEKLVGQMSTNPEIQAFLDNVPSYMGKIQRVHLAAKSGALRELQAALDRRKFATARDKISPGGATPLHVSVIFGKTGILRYLAARFPETLSAVDFEGRTPLHYAAVIKDNGHYYNMLLGFGSNPKDQDENGVTAEEYHKQIDKFLNHKEVLKTFGVDEELLDEMLSDKENEMKVTEGGTTATATATNINGGNNGQMDIPMFRTEEGRYLATSLGEPLIKGLTEVANTRPQDPIAFLATYLYNFANQNKGRLNSGKNSPLLGAEPRISGPVNGETAIKEYEEEPIDEAPIKYEEHPSNTLQSGAKRSLRDNLPPTPAPPATPGAPEAAISSDNRDEHGQSMLHFASARGHAKGALLQLVKESSVSPAFRDELYRTARDVSIQANLPNNTTELDRWLLDVAATGDTEKMTEMILEGYDHILDIVGDEGEPIMEVVSERGHTQMIELLNIIGELEEMREKLHQGIREGDENLVQDLLSKKVSNSAPESQKLLSGKMMARAKNSFGRCSLHIAVLAQQHDLVEFIARTYPETLRIGDNLERTALHYAMGIDNVESTSRILIKAGAKRVLKDLKGRQPSYYFMNKSDILRLKEEEESY